MTTLVDLHETCAICGEIGRFHAVGSTNQFGSPDLDLRPAEMMRSTIEYAIRRCASCGYCAPQLSKAVAGAGQVIDDPRYRGQLQDPALPDLANSFLCWSMIVEAGGDAVDTAWAAVNAAWICDDALAHGVQPVVDSEPSTRCRRRAIEFLERAQALGQPFFVPVRGGQEVLLADLHRRSGQFEQALAVCEQGLQVIADGPPRVGNERSDEVMTERVLRYQLALSAAGDAGRHTISEVPK